MRFTLSCSYSEKSGPAMARFAINIRKNTALAGFGKNKSDTTLNNTVSAMNTLKVNNSVGAAK